MKNKTFAAIFSLFFVAVLSVALFEQFGTQTHASGDASVSSYLSIIGVSEAESSAPSLPTAQIEALIAGNHVFSDLIYDDQALIEAATLVLKEQAVDGKLEKSVVHQFLRDCYGHAPDDDNGVYPVANNMVSYQSAVDNIEQRSNGTLEVSSTLTVEYSKTDARSYSCKTVISQSKQSKYGYIILSAELQK